MHPSLQAGSVACKDGMNESMEVVARRTDALNLLDLPWPAMNCIVPQLEPAGKLALFRWGRLHAHAFVLRVSPG